MANIVTQKFRIPEQINNVATYVVTLDDQLYLGATVALDSSGRGSIWIHSKTGALTNPIIVQTFRLPEDANSLEAYMETLDDAKFLATIVALDSSGRGTIWVLSQT